MKPPIYLTLSLGLLLGSEAQATLHCHTRGSDAPPFHCGDNRVALTIEDDLSAHFLLHNGAVRCWTASQSYSGSLTTKGTFTLNGERILTLLRGTPNERDIGSFRFDPENNTGVLTLFSTEPGSNTFNLKCLNLEDLAAQ